MPSSPISFNQFMERRNPRRSNTNESATVKAAAWAWYQRGSGSEEKPTCVYDLTRARRAPKPSRFRLEAIATAGKTLKGSSSPSPTSSPNPSDISLLDTYEIERISRELDYYIESSSAEYYGRSRGGDRGGGGAVPLPESGVKGKIKSKKKQGFWQRHVVVCGSRDDVVDGRGYVRRPEKYLPVVRVANSLPRAAHA